MLASCFRPSFFTLFSCPNFNSACIKHLILRENCSLHKLVFMSCSFPLRILSLFILWLGHCGSEVNSEILQLIHEACLSTSFLLNKTHSKQYFNPWLLSLFTLSVFKLWLAWLLVPWACQAQTNVLYTSPMTKLHFINQGNASFPTLLSVQPYNTNIKNWLWQLNLYAITSALEN